MKLIIAINLQITYLDGEAAADAVEEACLAGQLGVEVGRARLDHLRQRGVLGHLQQLHVLTVAHVQEGSLQGGPSINDFCAMLPIWLLKSHR